MAADLAIDRASVQASAAADTPKGFAILGLGEDFGAAVVQQDEVKFLGPIFFAGAARAAEDAGVDGHWLAGGTAGEEFEHDCQVREARHKLFDADEADERARSRDGLPRVPFVFDHADLAGLGDEKIPAGDPKISTADFVAKKCGAAFEP